MQHTGMFFYGIWGSAVGIVAPSTKYYIITFWQTCSQW
jgi:hypothetical protein